MTDDRSKLRWGRLGLLMLALTALVNAGCLVAAVGAAGVGQAAAGYTYINGLLYRDYKANIADTLAAVRVSLQELSFPLTKEKTDTGSAYLTTSTGDGHTVRIYLDLVASPIPAEGMVTRVGIRVGFSGDEAVSARLLDQISRHIASPLPPGAVVSPRAVAPPDFAAAPAHPRDRAAPAGTCCNCNDSCPSEVRAAGEGGSKATDRTAGPNGANENQHEMSQAVSRPSLPVVR